MKLAEAYGIWAVRVTDRAGVRAAIDDAAAVDGPAIIDFRVEREENVYPHVPAGGSVFEMLEGPTPAVPAVPPTSDEAPAWRK